MPPEQAIPALSTCAAFLLSTAAISVAQPAAERITIRVDSESVSDFHRFLAGLAQLSQRKPVVLEVIGSPSLSPLEVGTDASFGHAFPDEPVLFRVAQRVIHIGTGPAFQTISDAALPQYLKQMMDAAAKSGSRAVPILAADRGVTGSRGLAVLHQFRRSGITRIRIPGPAAEQAGASDGG